MSQPQRLLLTSGLLLHTDPPRVETADIRVVDGVITEMGRLERQPGEACLDLGGAWVMPGLVVGHHHLYSALAGGMPLPANEPPTFADMLAQVWWKLDKALDREGVEVSALVGGLGALRCGVTTVIDHHASPSFIEGSLEVMDHALGSLGLRRVLCYEVTDRGGPAEAKAGLQAHENLLARGPDGWTAVMVGGHANFTLSDDTLRACGDLARSAGVGFHIHVAEAVDDQQAVGEPLVARLERCGALLPGSLLCHAVHLTPEELRRVEGAGAFVSHQARSNMNNHVGYAPVASFGANTILGTDGIGSDMFAEIQTAYFQARQHFVPWFPNRFLQALTAGASFAGGKLGVTLGKLAPGAAADLIVCNPMPGPPLSQGNLAGAFVFRFNAGMVRHVMVGGQWRLWDGDPVGINTADLDQRARKAAVDTWGRMA